MQIDHILPESLDKKPEKKAFSEYKLDENLTLNCLENYVPSSKKANREKGNSILAKATDLLLKKAKRLAPKIRARINQILKDIDLERSKTTIRHEFSGDHQKMENLYNLLTNEDEDFPDENYINDGFGTSVYCYSKKKILLTSRREVPRSTCTQVSVGIRGAAVRSPVPKRF